MDEQLPEFGGYTKVARILTEHGPRTISRQGVHSWWLNRERTRFPDAARYTKEGWKEFCIAEVIEWYEAYVPSKLAHWGGRGKR